MADEIKYSTLIVGDDAITAREHLAITAPVALGDAYVALGFKDVGGIDFTSPASRATLFEMHVKLRFEYADAMLAQRKQ